MIVPQLFNPKSIAIIGASNDITKPGGKVLKNILDHAFSGKIFPVNPKETIIQQLTCYNRVTDIPEVDLAIIAIAASQTEEAIRILAEQKNCKAFILFSAGFSEAGEEGKLLEERCVAIVEKHGGTLVGPNCIGVITKHYKGVFAGPIPEYDDKGCDLVSASGATMVFILEEAISRGLKFSGLYSIGNSAQIGVEDMLEYWDNNFDAKKSSRIKLLYLEQVNDPRKFLLHARSLVQKGCRIAAIKAGSTEEGANAVTSHTGSLAGSNTAVSALFRKAGIVRCYSRVELVYVAAIFSMKQLHGNRIAVITHAGGPGVMLTDVLIKGGLEVPRLSGPKADELLSKLHAGSSVSNPIDFLATGTAEQLGEILEYVDKEFEEIDASVVVFGTTGMWSVNNVYQVLHEKINTLKKPIFPILPSVIQAAEEVSHFHAKGHINFTDEVSFGYVLARVCKTTKPFEDPVLPEVETTRIRTILDNAREGYLTPEEVSALMDAVGIATVKQEVANHVTDIASISKKLGFPLVMKVNGPVHKTDVGGVVLNIHKVAEAERVFNELMLIEGAESVLLQQQKSGIEIFIGSTYEPGFGHIVLCGLGGIFVEVFKDIAAALAPVGMEEALAMVRHLQSYPIIKGVRGKVGVEETILAETIVRLSALLKVAPEIEELDMNPLLGSKDELLAVDVRVKKGGGIRSKSR